MSWIPVRKSSLALILSALVSIHASSQSPSLQKQVVLQDQSASHQDDSQNMGGMRMQQSIKLQLPSPHEGSGTSWLPASVAGPEWMWTRGGWDLMAHGTIFIDYN